MNTLGRVSTDTSRGDCSRFIRETDVVQGSQKVEVLTR
jgi:hypothetical protein